MPLDGLGFIVLGFTPGAMGQGNWLVGLVTDERARADQRDAITAIASGAAGGPMAAVAGLVGTFLGVESAAIRFDRSGASWSVTAAPFLDMAASGAMGLNPAAGRAARARQHRPPGGQPVRSGARLEEPRQRAGPEVGRPVGDQQRPVRAVLLAGCLILAASSAPPRHERLVLSICLIVVTALAWAYLVRLERQMSAAMEYDAAMAAMGMDMRAPWGAADVGLTFVMWVVMMIGMMMPSAGPVLLLFSGTAAARQERGLPVSVLAFGCGYLAVWAAFSAAATLAQWGLHEPRCCRCPCARPVPSSAARS